MFRKIGRAISNFFYALVRFYRAITPIWVVIIATALSALLSWYSLQEIFNFSIRELTHPNPIYTYFKSSDYHRIALMLLCIFFSRSLRIVLSMFGCVFDLDTKYVTKTYYSSGRVEVTEDYGILAGLLAFVFFTLVFPIIPCGFSLIMELIRIADER